MKQVVQKQKLLNYIQQIPITNEFNSFLNLQPIPKRILLSKPNLQTLDSICDKINQREQFDCRKTDAWKMGEYKLFIWVSLFHAFNSGIAIQEMAQKDYEFLQTIFLKRSEQKMRYQILCIYPSPDYSKGWSQNEIALLTTLIQRQQKYSPKLEWKLISLDLFYESKGDYFKTFGQCRQMWLNHLNPSLNKKTWKKQQDYLLMTLYKNYKKSWAKIAKKFNGKRTAHMVKNRYYALIKRKKSCSYGLSNQQIEDKLIQSLSQKVQKTKKNNQPKLDKKQPLIHYNQTVQGQRVAKSQGLENCFSEDQGIQSFGNQEELKNDEKTQQKSSPLQEAQLKKIQQPQKIIQIRPQTFVLNKCPFDQNLFQIPKYLDSNDLLSKLGCVHIQQIEQAFQECENFNKLFQF